MGTHFFFILASRPYLSDYWPHKNGSPIKMSRISLGKQFCYFWNNVQRKSFSKLITKQKKMLCTGLTIQHFHGYYLFCACTLEVVTWTCIFFTRPTDCNFSRQEKNPYDRTIFFYFKFLTDRLGKIGSSSHSRNQPTVG